MHTHNNCPHFNVKYCSCCDVTYCEGCDREWGFRRYYTDWYEWKPMRTWYPLEVTSTTTAASSNQYGTENKCKHG